MLCFQFNEILIKSDDASKGNQLSKGLSNLRIKQLPVRRNPIENQAISGFSAQKSGCLENKDP